MTNTIYTLVLGTLRQKDIHYYCTGQNKTVLTSTETMEFFRESPTKNYVTLSDPGLSVSVLKGIHSFFLLFGKATATYTVRKLCNLPIESKLTEYARLNFFDLEVLLCNEPSSLDAGLADFKIGRYLKLEQK